MNDFYDFNDAAKELDKIANSGFFGDTIKTLNKAKDTTDQSEFLYNCIVNMFSNDQYGAQNIIRISIHILH